MKRLASVLISIGLLSDVSGAAPSKNSAAKQLRATSFVIKGGEEGSSGKLYVTVGDKEKKIADAVAKAWLIDDGRQVVYSRRKDGAGGFENDGESLRVYDLGSGKTRKILSEYVGVDALLETKLSTGESALLVRMSDGASFVSSFAVVDPKRGEVLSRAFAELTEINGDQITLAFYAEKDWDAINDERGWTNPESDKVILPRPKVAAAKTDTHDLKEVLKGNVIYNKPRTQSEDR